MKPNNIALLLLAVTLSVIFSSCPPLPGPIKVASFNLQIYGQEKAGHPEVVDVLARIIREFDVCAVQEIRDAAGTAINALAAAVDAGGVDYEYVLGPRVGRTSSKEQYAVFYNTATIQALPGAYTYAEGGTDTFEREPYIAMFRTRAGRADFIIIDIHTKPADAASEIQALPAVMANAQAVLGEPDVICLGDFNADDNTGNYYDESRYTETFPAATYNWIIGNDEDTMVDAGSDNTYDRLVTTKSMDEDYTGQAGVFRFDEVYHLDAAAAAAVSDHYPVWAEFSVEDDTD